MSQPFVDAVAQHGLPGGPGSPAIPAGAVLLDRQSPLRLPEDAPTAAPTPSGNPEFPEPATHAPAREPRKVTADELRGIIMNPLNPPDVRASALEALLAAAHRQGAAEALAVVADRERRQQDRKGKRRQVRESRKRNR